MRDIDYLKSEYHDHRHWMLEDRSKKILDIFKKYVDKKDSILELGCSSGRNLVYLHSNGYKNLTGLEMYPIQEREEFKLIRGRFEDVALKEYDVMFSASFLQEFQPFPQKEFDKALQRCKKYFMIFGDYLQGFKHDGFTVVEKIPAMEPFTQPIIILKNERTT